MPLNPMKTRKDSMKSHQNPYKNRATASRARCETVADYNDCGFMDVYSTLWVFNIAMENGPFAHL